MQVQGVGMEMALLATTALKVNCTFRTFFVTFSKDRFFRVGKGPVTPIPPQVIDFFRDTQIGSGG